MSEAPQPPITLSTKHLLEIRLSPFKQAIVSLVTYALLLSVAFYLSYALRFDFAPSGEFMHLRNLQWGSVVFLELLALYLSGQLRGFFSFFRTPDLLATALPLFAVHLGFLTTYYLLPQNHFVPPRGILLANLLLSLAAICALRIGLRIFRERWGDTRKPTPQNMRRVAIYGIGETGASLAATWESQPHLGKKPVVFIDDNPDTHGHSMHNIRVAGGFDHLREICREYRVDQIVFTLPATAHQRRRKLVEAAMEMDIEVMIVPPASTLTPRPAPRPVELSDLIGRPTGSPTDLREASKLLHNQVAMVTGAGGSIGSELCRQILAQQPALLLLFEQSETLLYVIEQELKINGYAGRIVPLLGSITDAARLEQVFARYRPSLVFHAAAHKHVPMLESQPTEALRNNVLGTLRLARAAVAHDVERFVMISTDKAIYPRSVMGASKRIAELVVQAIQQTPNHKTQFMAVRFGNVLGSSGSVFPLFKKQIAEGGPLTVTHPDMTRFFMTIEEAAGLVIQSATMGKGGEIFVLDMGQPMKIADMARMMIRLSGFQPDVDIQIQYTGLRPGEKMYEELTHKEEHCDSTSHPRISRYLPTEPIRIPLDQLIASVEKLLSETDPSRVKNAIHDLIPEYTPDPNSFPQNVPV